MSLDNKQVIVLTERPTIAELDDLHDGRLVSLELKGDALELGCELMSGGRVRIRANGLYRMRADRFVQGNIVRVLRVSEECRTEFRRAVTLSDDERIPEEWFDREFNQAQRVGWHLLTLESSYGCELVAVAKGRVAMMVEPA